MKAHALLAILPLHCPGPTPGGRTAKPNILWLIAEDFGPHLGCYGTKEVWTPNLDQLAAEGVRYTRFFTTAPVCSPSRSAFMTGMYQTTIGAHNHRSHRDDGYKLPDGVRVLPTGCATPATSPPTSGTCPPSSASRARARPTGTSTPTASRSTPTRGTI